MTSPLNPMLSTQQEAQHLSWKHFKNKIPYSVELILPLRAVTVQQYADGGYWIVHAQVLEDNKCNNSDLRKGVMVMIDFPLKTFERAWVAIPAVTRNSITTEDNVRMTFIKETRQSIFITDVEKIQATPEQKALCDQIYPSKNKEEKRIEKEEY